MTIARLPQVILQNIKDFLIDNDLSIYEIERRRFDGNFDCFHWLEGQEAWRNFLSCFKGENGYWRDVIRKKMMDYRLNHYYSEKYFLDPIFRGRVLSCLHDSYKQLSIDLSHNALCGITDEEGRILSNLRRLNLSRSCSQFRRLPAISHVYELCAAEVNIEGEVTTLSDIKILNLSHNHTITKIIGLEGLRELSINGCTSLTEISPLPTTLKFLSYSRNNHLDALVSQLKELEELVVLSFMKNQGLQLSVPSFLPNLRKLETSRNLLHLPTLYSLPKLEVLTWEKPGRSSDLSKEVLDEHVSTLLDQSSEFFSHIKEFSFSMPKSRPTLNFSHFLQIEDLTIADIDSPEGLQGLTTLKKVSVINSPLFNDVQAFRHCTLVILNKCSAVTDVSALARVREIVIENCDNLADISGIGQRSRRVEIIRCPRVKDVSSLGKVRHVVLDFCNEIEDVSALVHVPYLSLRGCTKIQDFSGFNDSRQRYLNLTGCHHLNDHHLPALAHIDELIISYCKNIHDISVLRNKRLTARSCLGLSEARLFGDHVKVDLSYCMDLQRVLIFGNVLALCVLETALDLSSVFLFVFGSLKHITAQFEYPNSDEAHAIHSADEHEFNNDEEEEDDDGVYDDEEDEEINDDHDEFDEDSFDDDGEEWEDIDEDDEHGDY